MKTIRILLLTFGLLAIFSSPTHAQSNQPLVLVLNADGPVMPPMLEYIQRGIAVAGREEAEALVIQLNTPGGSIDIMNQIVEAIRASQVPVIVYVAPRGAWAASAGSLVTMSAHVAAMAPETVIGAASPVDSTGQDLSSTEKAKTMNALTAKVDSLTARRGEEAQKLAEDMIINAKAVTAEEALQAHLIDFIATDFNDLLNKLDGFPVHVGDSTRTFHTANARTESLPMSFVEQLLFALSDPNIISILLTIGMLAIYFEFSHPGGWVSGFIGVVCIALGIYGGGSLSVHWFGAVFMVIAFVLFILDIKAPTHGALTAAGTASFIFGLLVLFNSPGTPQFQHVSIPLVAGIGVTLGAMAFVVMLVALRVRHAPVRAGAETLAGKTGTARTSVDASGGQVQVMSELWSAEAVEGSEQIRKGDHVEVVEVEGLRLKVRKKS